MTTSPNTAEATETAALAALANALFAGKAPSGGAPAWLASAPAAPPQAPGFAVPSDQSVLGIAPIGAPAGPSISVLGSSGAPGAISGADPLLAFDELLLAPRFHPEGGPSASDHHFLAHAPRTAGKPASFHTPSPVFDVHAVRRDFPILSQQINGRNLVWFDNAATTQKPRQVIERISRFYEEENSNIHRAAHALAARATDAYEDARETVRSFINARSTHEIVFTRGATEAINLVAQSWGEENIGPGDEIVVSHLEHHANIVPWQHLAKKKGAKLKVIPVDDDGQILLDAYAQLLTPRTKLVAFTLVSNALGTVTPAPAIVALAKGAGARVLADAAQSVSHLATDVQALGADWLVFSGHKVFAPTGIGVLYGREELLNATQPWQRGGNMIEDVTFEESRFQKAPARFEAGTGSLADAVGLGAALKYVRSIGIGKIAAYEHWLLEYATHRIQDIPGVRLVGTAREKTSVLSFVLEGYTTQQVGVEFDKHGIAVRTGHHCAQPILRRFGLEATVRPSLAFYNTCAEVDLMASVLRSMRR